MNRTVVLFACALALWLVADKTVAGWGSGGCAPVGRASFPAPSYTPAPAFTGWQTQGAWTYYFDHGVQTCAYNPTTLVYRSFDAATGSWSAVLHDPYHQAATPSDPFAVAQADHKCAPSCTCTHCGCTTGKPCDTGCPCGKCRVAATPAAAGGVPNFGLMTDRMLHSGEPESYTICGRPVTQAQAAEALVGADLIDDSSKLRLTVIGPDAERKAVLADLDTNPLLASIRDKVLVQGYAPTHWAVAGCGFITTGKPTVYLQSPDGKVLHRQDDYADGAAGLLEAIRRTDPNYGPGKDRDERKSGPLGVDWKQLLTLLTSPMGIGAGVLLAVLLLRKKAMAP